MRNESTTAQEIATKKKSTGAGLLVTAKVIPSWGGNMAYDFVEVGELSDKIQQDQKGGASIHFTEVDGRSIYKIGDKPIILLELAPGKHKIYLEDQHPKKQVATRHGARAIEVDIEPGGYM